MEEKNSNIVKEIKIGETTIKFSNESIAKTKEEREQRIRIFKQTLVNLMKGSEKNE